MLLAPDFGRRYSYSNHLTNMSIFILDCGRRTSHFINTNNDNYSTIEHKDVLTLDIPELADGDTIVIEDAHLRSKETNSLAQPFTYVELKELETKASERNITIKLFPQMTTPKARDLANIEEKNDHNDLIAIANYIKINPDAVSRLKKFRPVSLEQYQAKNADKWSDREQLNADVNGARNEGYGFASNGYSDAISKWIETHSTELYHRLDNEELQAMMGLKMSKRGEPKLNKISSPGRLYSVVATLLRPNGELRLRSGIGKSPYWKYVKEVYFAMTPYHMKGGVVASNIKHHFRRAESDFKVKSTRNLSIDERKELAAARTRFDKKLQKVWNIIRQMIVVEGIR